MTSLAEKLQTFREPGYRGSYDEITSLGSSPLAILELGLNNVEGEQTRSAWIADAAATLRSATYGRLKAVSWYVVRGGEFESTPASSPEFGRAFRTAFADPFFGARPRFTGNCLPSVPKGVTTRGGVLRWRRVPNATSYEVWRRAARVGSTTETSFRVRDARGRFRIRAVNPLGKSAFASTR